MGFFHSESEANLEYDFTTSSISWLNSLQDKSTCFDMLLKSDRAGLFFKALNSEKVFFPEVENGFFSISA